jgi:hypothetical protein
MVSMIWVAIATVALLWFATTPKNSKSKMLKESGICEIAICFNKGSHKMATGIVCT